MGKHTIIRDFLLACVLFLQLSSALSRLYAVVKKFKQEKTESKR